jgi:hypothetical protein
MLYLSWMQPLGWKPKAGFKSGFDPRRNVSGKPGKPRGSKGRIPHDIQEILRARGDREGVDILSEFANSQLVDPGLRIQAAVALSAYQRGKAPAMRFVPAMTGLEAPSTIQEALAYQSRLVHLVAAGLIDVDSAAAIQSHLHGFIEAKVAIELAEKLERGEALLREYEARGIGAASVVPVGGLPVPPGFEGVRLPQFGSPTIEGSTNPPSNPWADPTPEVAASVKAASDVAAAVKTGPGAQKRPPRRSKPKPGPETAPDAENRS